VIARIKSKNFKIENSHLTRLEEEMAKTVKIEVTNKNFLNSIRQFISSILMLEDIKGVLAAQKLPFKKILMPMLVASQEKLEGIDPLAPVFPLNAAKIVSKLTRKPIGSKIAVIMRSCEIRAFIELVKLKQGAFDEIVIIGIDCPGAYKNEDYYTLAGDDTEKFTNAFCKDVFSGKEIQNKGTELSSACRACEHFIPLGADIIIELFGIDIDNHILIRAMTPKGDEITDKLTLPEEIEPSIRNDIISSITAERKIFRDKMFEDTHAATDTLEKLTDYFSRCINCYNCRVACPVCYCKECVFVTDVFNHEPSQYMQWATRKGAVKMPTDTIFYHITRLAHMSTACIGCGQCSSACPNNISVMELFRMTAYRTQKIFDYEAGRSIEEKPPLSVFKEDELNNVVGI
jgi:formate dehydrogenase (coenzyme F420) beta subunit